MQNQPKTSAEEMKDHLNMLERRREQQRLKILREEMRKPTSERVKHLLK